MRLRRSKYGAVPTVVDGVRFDSKREARRWMELRLLERAGEIKDLRRQVAYPLAVPGGEVIGRYVADFVYLEKLVHGWRETVEDCKGLRTPMYRWKAKHLRAEHGIEVRET